MTELTGMDINQIFKLARDMSTEAVAVELLIGPLGPTLENAPWVGPDRDRFIDEWKTRHLTPLLDLIQALRDAAVKAKAHADDQVRASAVQGQGGGGGSW